MDDHNTYAENPDILRTSPFFFPLLCCQKISILLMLLFSHLNLTYAAPRSKADKWLVACRKVMRNETFSSR